MNPVMSAAMGLAENGWLPEGSLRGAIRGLLRQRLREVDAGDCEREAEAWSSFVAAMDDAPIAPLPDRANEQHYELPPAFFQAMLGPACKYSCCYWPPGVNTLEQAEQAALEVTAERIGLTDGMSILELGCGWGSLTLWLARRFPRSRITAVSNSAAQRDLILSRAAAAGLQNLSVITCDMNRFSTDSRFDCVVSVEMFEHMRNYRLLFSRVAQWLEPEGYFFLHLFTHRGAPYEFLERGPSDWMGRYFFAGGMMPSDDLPLAFQDHLALRRRWCWDGRHYARTADAWLENLYARREALLPVLGSVYSAAEAMLWWQRWRLFLLACSELFGYEAGQRWRVSHYLFQRRQLGREASE